MMILKVANTLHSLKFNVIKTYTKTEANIFYLEKEMNTMTIRDGSLQTKLQEEILCRTYS